MRIKLEDVRMGIDGIEIIEINPIRQDERRQFQLTSNYIQLIEGDDKKHIGIASIFAGVGSEFHCGHHPTIEVSSFRFDFENGDSKRINVAYQLFFDDTDESKRMLKSERTPLVKVKKKQMEVMEGVKKYFNDIEIYDEVDIVIYPPMLTRVGELSTKSQMVNHDLESKGSNIRISDVFAFATEEDLQKTISFILKKSLQNEIDYGKIVNVVEEEQL